MAGMVKSMLIGRSSLATRSCLLQILRHSHRLNLWEQILGKKIEASTVKALEDVLLEFRVSKSVPSWLPFLPNSSFWIPCSENSIKNLEEIAEAIQLAPSRRKRFGSSFTVSPDLAANGISSSKALSSIQVMDQLVDKLKEIPDGSKILLVDGSDMDDLTEEINFDEDDDDEETDEESESEEEELDSVKTS